MDQKIKLLIPLFIDGHSYEAGELVTVDQERAKRICDLNQAEMVVPHPHEPHGTRHTGTTTTPAPVSGHDPHQQHVESATSMPPTERAARTEHPDPKGHHKKS